MSDPVDAIRTGALNEGSGVTPGGGAGVEPAHAVTRAHLRPQARQPTTAGEGSSPDLGVELDLREELQLIQTRLDIRIDQDAGHLVIRVFDRESGEVVRQVPADEILSFYRSIRRMTGVVVDRHV